MLVLSDANAAFSLPPDEGRQEIVWVDDFSKAEANAYLSMNNFLLNNDKKRNELFQQIGTRPARLEKLVAKGKCF